jgi:GMP synthase (glutamine-hydrolysing)
MPNIDAGSPAVALLDASIGETPAERNVRRELDAPVAVYKVSEGNFPPAASAEAFEFDAAVVSGSQTSVYDDEEWIEGTEAWTSEAIRIGLPVLGLCWGHQLIAQAVGGDVDPMGRYELGYATVEVLEDGSDDPLFGGIGSSFTAFETHSDEVTRLPAEATILAESERSLQAFRVSNAWGVQFHPEYDLQTARWVTENKRGAIEDEVLDAIFETITPERHTETAEAARVFDTFVAFVARLQAGAVQ